MCGRYVIAKKTHSKFPEINENNYNSISLNNKNAEITCKIFWIKIIFFKLPNEKRAIKNGYPVVRTVSTAFSPKNSCLINELFSEIDVASET